MQAGVAPGIGASVEAAGLMHLGIGIGITPRAAGVGWVYGVGYVFGLDAGGSRVMDATTDIYWPATHVFPHYSPPGLHISSTRPPPGGGGEGGIHQCYLMLPAVFTLGDDDKPSSIWDGPATPARRWARVHAFDVSVGVHALLVGASVGFSPGEFLDFLLGWFGLDIAGDDTPIPEPPARRVR